MSLLLLRKTNTAAAARPHKSTQTLHWCSQWDNINRKSPTHTHTHTDTRKQDEGRTMCFCTRRGHGTSTAAVITMISSNEGATGVNATRLFFFPGLSLLLLLFFWSPSLFLTHIRVLYHVIVFQSRPTSSYPVTGHWQCWQERPAKSGREHKGSCPHLRHRRGRCTADEVCNATYPRCGWCVSKVVLFITVFETLPNLSPIVGKLVTKINDRFHHRSAEKTENREKCLSRCCFVR